MKRFLFLICFCFSSTLLFANHITGGELYYELITKNGNDYTYRIFLKLYRDCNAPQGSAQLDPQAPIAIYNRGTGAMVWSKSVPMRNMEIRNLSNPSPCIQPPPVVCYEVGYYVDSVTLTGQPQGYVISYQRCCRIAGINNIAGNSNAVGATYSAEIPGTIPVLTGPENNSAHFTGEDRVAICANTNFCYDFGAADADATTFGDKLRYSFCTAYTGGTNGAPAPNPPMGPPYAPIPYSAPDFDASFPMGLNVTIDSLTGMMCGVAPNQGIYVVTVCVTEYRNNLPIAVQRKDLQIKVGDCNIADAALKPEYISCDGFTYNFFNEAPPSPLVNSWYWDFGDGTTATQPTPTHTYADTGTYIIKLVVNRGQQCSDSAISRIKVYPGFFPGFVFSGICANKPTQFTDTTKTRYGFVNTWKWDFGDIPTTSDTSSQQNPVYTYPSTGVKSVRFIVTNSKGCIDTVFKDVTILDKPPLSVPAKDTLMCVGDSVRLQAIGQGTFSWTPNTNIIDANTATPTVFPTTTTTYTVQLNQNGCIATDSARVRVVNFVTMVAMPDTTICLTDSMQLYANGDALTYSWTPAATLSNANTRTPRALPGPGTTTYRVTGRIGRCVATDDVNVFTVPYPVAAAGPDDTVCFRSSTVLQGSIVGSTFNWSPANTLSGATTLTPTASPIKTTAYVLTAFDNLGCPKPGRDTVVVTVLPDVIPFAGNDTAVIAGQPLQLTATGGVTYLWTPGTALSDTDIPNPVALYDGSFDSIRYKVFVSDIFGCTDSTTVKVRIFRTVPQVFVPTAFTPNRDGKNDVFRPIAVGISKIEYFRVFNRWGQLVFSTTTNEQGWDGKIKGSDQGTNTFVWVVKAVDYLGKPFFAKGTVTLIR